MTATVPAQRSARITAGSRKRRGRGLNARQAGYLLGLLQGGTGRGAALAAGYSQRTAENLAEKVEGKGRGRFSVMRQFAEAIGRTAKFGGNGSERNLEDAAMSATATDA